METGWRVCGEGCACAVGRALQCGRRTDGLTVALPPGCAPCRGASRREAFEGTETMPCVCYHSEARIKQQTRVGVREALHQAAPCGRTQKEKGSEGRSARCESAGPQTHPPGWRWPRGGRAVGARTASRAPPPPPRIFCIPPSDGGPTLPRAEASRAAPPRGVWAGGG